MHSILAHFCSQFDHEATEETENGVRSDDVNNVGPFKSYCEFESSIVNWPVLESTVCKISSDGEGYKIFAVWISTQTFEDNLYADSFLAWGAQRRAIGSRQDMAYCTVVCIDLLTLCRQPIYFRFGSKNRTRVNMLIVYLPTATKNFVKVIWGVVDINTISLLWRFEQTCRW